MQEGYFSPTAVGYRRSGSKQDLGARAFTQQSLYQTGLSHSSTHKNLVQALKTEMQTRNVLPYQKYTPFQQNLEQEKQKKLEQLKYKQRKNQLAFLVKQKDKLEEQKYRTQQEAISLDRIKNDQRQDEKNNNDPRKSMKKLLQMSVPMSPQNRRSMAYMTQTQQAQLEERPLIEDLQNFTKTNLTDLLNNENRFCIDCNDHRRHEPIRLSYPKAVKTMYTAEYKNLTKHLNDGVDQKNDIVAYQKSQRQRLGGYQLMANTTHGTEFQFYNKGLYKPHYRDENRPKTQNKLNEGPQLKLTTYKTTFPFWETQGSRAPQVKPLDNGISSTNYFYRGLSDYQEHFQDPEKIIDPQVLKLINSKDYKKMFKSYSSYIGLSKEKLQSQTQKMRDFKYPNPEAYILSKQKNIMKDSLRVPASIHVPKDLLQPTSHIAYHNVQNPHQCHDNVNYRTKTITKNQ